MGSEAGINEDAAIVAVVVCVVKGIVAAARAVSVVLSSSLPPGKMPSSLLSVPLRTVVSRTAILSPRLSIICSSRQSAVDHSCNSMAKRAELLIINMLKY
jgi:hypothetical protein